MSFFENRLCQEQVECVPTPVKKLIIQCQHILCRSVGFALIHGHFLPGDLPRLLLGIFVH